MSFGSSPVYVQTTATTGTLMLGKISVGVRSADKVPNIAMSNDITMNVYGLLNAVSTIHTPAIS
jgi:hypothetical protein